MRVDKYLVASLATLALVVAQPAAADTRSADSLPSAGLQMAAGIVNADDQADNVRCLEYGDDAHHYEADELGKWVLDSVGELVACDPAGAYVKPVSSGGGGLGVAPGLLISIIGALAFAIFQFSDSDSPG